MRGGKLAIGRGPLQICVDTGYTGDVALPRKILRRLKLQYVGTIDYQLANGAIQMMDQWLGHLVTGAREHAVIFMEGSGLLGMDFITNACRSLRIDCTSGEVLLTLRR